MIEQMRKRRHLLYKLEGMLEVARLLPDAEDVDRYEDIDNAIDTIKLEIEDLNEELGYDSQKGIQELYSN